MRNPILDALFIRATVVSVAPAGRFRKVRLSAPKLAGVDWTPGQQVRIDCGPDTAFAPTLRTYSVWDHEDDWLDGYCLVHGDGPGSIWAAQADAGQQVRITKPKGDFVIRPADCHVFVGDETASAAFGPMIRALPDDVPVHTIVETGTEADRLPLTRDVTWLLRSPGTPPEDPSALLAAVAEAKLPDVPGSAYLAGEARTIQAVRNVLVNDRGWARKSVYTKPFWTPGKRGLE
ncbi:siderophore-interacting protein [Rugosimonospora africana]|uniref:FAD-binding FR-type domain-containing protein n=1 Tax=Rugosimonospora africana TaxID=556532 RepID=A0A8J3QM01_9ACTN|nr:siderophore-interacting protein [Rugosimonospora africana]GIH12497.1 hypothetical protein Raf01_06690 [Rugosimonospora africana]